MNKLMMAVMIGGLAVSANAVELSLKSEDSSVTWNFSALNWIPFGGGEFQKYSDCDVAHIGPDFTGSTVTIGDYVGPTELRINNTQSLTLANENVNGHGLSGKLKHFTKYGIGDLTLDFLDWRNYQTCDWHVYGGCLFLGRNTGYGDAQYRFCNNTAVGDVVLHVHDGAKVWPWSSNFISSASDSTEDAQPSVVVYTNGTLVTGWDSTTSYTYMFFTLKDLILDGGTLDLSRRSAWSSGTFKLTRKFAFKGKTPYTLKMSNMDQRLMLPKTRLLEFAVDDITGDDADDVTMDGTGTDKGFFMGPAYTTTTDAEGVKHAIASYPAGFKKTGAGTLHVKQKLYLTSECPSGNNGWGSRGLIGIDGDIRVEEGTLNLDNANNSITGRIEVVGGTLKTSGGGAWSNRAQSSLGDMTVAREIEIRENGVFSVGRLALGSIVPIEGTDIPDKAWIVARNGGKIRVEATHYTGPERDQSITTFGNLWLDGGTVEYVGGGEWPYGFGGVMGTWKFSGSTPYLMTTNATVEGHVILNCQQFVVNNNSKTTFDVADITGDAQPDVTFVVGLARGAYSVNGSWVCQPNVGFRKIGAGTMVCNFYTAQFGAGGVKALDGIVSVEEGTLEANSGLNDATLSVSAGAFVSGTGKVKGLTLADGAGFVVKPGQEKRLSVSGAATIAGAGIVDVIAEELEEDAPLKVAVADFNGTLAGSENLSAWKVRVNGVEIDGKVFLSGKTLMVCKRRGMSIFLR